MKPVTVVNPATPASQAALDRVLRMVERGETMPARDAGERAIRLIHRAKSARRAPRKGRG